MFKSKPLLYEKSLSGLRSNRSESNWDTYVRKAQDLKTSTFYAEKSGTIYDSSLSTPLKTFGRGDKISILSPELTAKGRLKFALINVDGVVGYTSISNIRKPSGGKTSELYLKKKEGQEHSTIGDINSSVELNGGKPITIIDMNGLKIRGVTGALKNEGSSAIKQEKYPDIMLTLANGRKVGISMKENSSPSLFGGGRKGFLQINRDIFKKMTDYAYEKVVDSGLFEVGSTNVKDIYILINNEEFLKDALVGGESMGGTIDYMGVGAKTPSSEYKNGVLTFKDLNLLNIDQYIDTIPAFYIRIRRRSSTEFFTDKIDEDGIRYFFTNELGVLKGRFVTEKTVPKNAFLVVPPLNL